jgi:O-acetylserine/cysteine efflux transporter
MKPWHLVLAVACASIWGFNFVAIKYALDSFPPLLLLTLRFLLASLPALFLPRPLPWRTLIPIGLTLFFGQYAFLFRAMTVGMPPGLASASLQIQVFLTILIAAVALRERPRARQIGGTIIAFAGLALIASTIGGDLTFAGFAFTMAAALSWATGNVLMRRAGANSDVLPLVVWLCLVPLLPAAAVSLSIEGPAAIGHALTHASAISIAALLFIAFVSTLVGFYIWGFLLKRYPAATVTPFALLVPVFGMSASALILDERITAERAAGVALIFAGLAIVALRLPGLRQARA